MVTFGEITQKTVSIKYKKTDIDGFVASGSVTYNKDKKVIDAVGSITSAENEPIADFNTYTSGDSMKVNLTNCIPDRMSEAVEVAQATLADLASQYPEE